MPRAQDYYANQPTATPAAPVAPVVSAPVQQPEPSVMDTQIQPKGSPISSQQQVAQNLKLATMKADQQFWSNWNSQPFIKKAPYYLLSSMYSMPSEQEWSQQSFGQKWWNVAKQNPKLTFDALKAMPATFLKMPLNALQTLTDIESDGYRSIRSLITGENPNNIKGAPTRYNVPFLGEVKGFKAYRDDLTEQGAGPGMAAFGAWGSSVADLAGTYSLLDTVKAALSPKLSTVDYIGKADDFRPIKMKQVEEIKGSMAAKASESKLSVGNVIKYEKTGERSVDYLRLPDKVASKYGGNSGNTFVKISPSEEGMMRVEVVQVRKSALGRGVDYLKSKFGQSKVVEGQFGPEVKVQSGLVKYDPQMFSRTPIAEDINPLMSMKSEVAPTGAGAKALAIESPGVVPPATPDVPFLGNEFANTTPAVKAPTRGKKGITLNDLEAGMSRPKILNRPVKGMENTLVTDADIDKLNYITEGKGLSKQQLSAVTQSLTGKTNLYDLTKQEAYNVSETMRLHGNAGLSEEVQLQRVRNEPLYKPTRYWMRGVEEKFKYPIYSGVYLPIEEGFGAMKGFQDTKMTASRAVYGEYAKPKNFEYRRAINHYLEGDKDAILKNPALSEQQKTELIKIADWTKNDLAEMGKASGLPAEYFVENYQSIIRENGGIYNIYKSEEIPAEIKPFFKFMQEGNLDPTVDDALALHDIYSRAMAKEMFLKKPMEDAKVIMETLPKDGNGSLHNHVNNYIQEKLQFQDEMDRFLNNSGKYLEHITNGKIDASAPKQFVNLLFANSYAGALGLPRIMPIIRNMVQWTMPYAEYGANFFAQGVADASAAGALKELKAKGLLVELGIPYGSELTKTDFNTSMLGRGVEGYKNLNNLTMAPQGVVDSTGRAITYYTFKRAFNYYWDNLLNGKVDWQGFEKGIRLDKVDPTLRSEVTKKLLTGDKEQFDQAFNYMARDVIDRTQFPYRRGAGMSWNYGTKGKFLGQFGIWPFEYAHTVASWLKTGQWDAIVRWLGVSAGVKRTMEDEFGINAEDWVNYLGGNVMGPLSGVPISPVIATGAKAVAALNASLVDNSAEVNKNADSIISSMKIYGGAPFGLGMKRVGAVMKSINRYQEGTVQSPTPDKPFGVWSSTGKLIRWVDFTELLQIGMGFKTMGDEASANLFRNMNFDSTQNQERINKAMNLLVDGKEDQFFKYVDKYQLNMGDISSKLKSYYLPLNDRVFERLPANIKGDYVNQIQSISQ